MQVLHPPVSFRAAMVYFYRDFKPLTRKEINEWIDEVKLCVNQDTVIQCRPHCLLLLYRLHRGWIKWNRLERGLIPLDLGDRYSAMARPGIEEWELICKFTNACPSGLLLNMHIMFWGTDD
jgi:hypothetical protein